ncbi:hypothetical protein HZA40_03825 [Candidatus Peregrinibacteria bacterium]|nr:hypothetical protein [Candidatus Peregrinibacteria bacterium]
MEFNQLPADYNAEKLGPQKRQTLPLQTPKIGIKWSYVFQNYQITEK